MRAHRRGGGHALGAHLDNLQAVLKRQCAGEDESSVLAEREARRGRRRVGCGRILGAQLLDGREASHEERRLRVHRVVELRLGAFVILMDG